MPVHDSAPKAPSIYAHARLEYRPAIGERVRFWTGRGSQGYATVQAIRFNQRLRHDMYLLDPEPDAIKGADFYPRPGKRSYWGPRDRGVTLAQIEHPPQIWFRNF